MFKTSWGKDVILGSLCNGWVFGSCRFFAEENVRSCLNLVILWQSICCLTTLFSDIVCKVSAGWQPFYFSWLVPNMITNTWARRSQLSFNSDREGNCRQSEAGNWPSETITCDNDVQPHWSPTTPTFTDVQLLIFQLRNRKCLKKK